MAKKKPDKKKRGSNRTLKARLLSFCFTAICLYFVYSIIVTQIEINKLRQSDAEVQRQIAELRLESDEMLRQLSDGGDDYIERIAREKLKYTAPGERVFEDK